MKIKDYRPIYTLTHRDNSKQLVKVIYWKVPKTNIYDEILKFKERCIKSIHHPLFSEHLKLLFTILTYENSYDIETKNFIPLVESYPYIGDIIESNAKYLKLNVKETIKNFFKVLFTV